MWLEGKTVDEITRLIIDLKNKDIKLRSLSISNNKEQQSNNNTPTINNNNNNNNNNNTPSNNNVIDDLSIHNKQNDNKDNILNSTKMFELRPRMPNSAAALYYQSQLTDLIRNEIADECRLFEILEHFFCQPLLLASQVLVQIPI